MKVYNEKKECCGCGACIKACPKNAITWKVDEKGFKYPKIDENKCVNCGICQKVCPFKQRNKQENIQEIYAIKNKKEDIRKKSSSGGFFDAITEYTFEKNGYLFGAIFDENNKVCHYGTNDIEKMQKFKTSKYVQSDTKETYREVKELLKQDKFVIYSGTPCQVQGLLNYLGENNTGKLMTIDHICHGVPSPQIFEEHIQYLNKKYNGNVKSINFRHKMKRGTQNLRINFDNGMQIIRTNAEDEYYRLFLSDYILRESCYHCKFTTKERVSDITMGDFWDFHDFLQDFEDGKGISLVILNTEKGKEIFKKLENMFEIKPVMTIEQCLQPNLQESSQKPRDVEKFWKEYSKKGYRKVIHKFPKYSLKLKIKKMGKKILKKLNLYNEE